MGIAVAILLTYYKKWRSLWKWLKSTHHSKVGIMYLTAGFAFFLRGGLDALIMRVQLALPQNEFWVFQGDKYNQMMTTHGTTMIFFVAMPLLIGLMNVAIPWQIGARDLAFPYLNAMSFWLFLAGGILVNISFVLGGSPTAGWTSYAPLALEKFAPGPGNDYYTLGLQVSGIGTLLTAINFLVTIINKRAPGMTFMRMPLFPWSTLVTSILILFAFPALTVALLLLMFDRLYGTNFLAADAGNSLIWQHLFWIFGHPEVYILVLPAFGIFSDVISTFSRKRVFGYSSMVISLMLIGFLGFMVWVHHMFTVGLGPTSNAIFAISTMSIAVPTGIKIFNWLFTIRGGVIQMRTAMLFALGFIPTFVIGGVTGVMLATVPADYQFHDSYFVVGHFHYVIIGGTILGIFAGIYYWWPKMFGFKLNEVLGKWHFWTFLIGFHITFFPMHIMGLKGMPRRVYTYLPEDGLAGLNMVSTIGAFMMAAGMMIFLWNLYYSARHSERSVGKDPWDGRTLEWTIPSPPPEYNFARIPKVRGIDPLWQAKTYTNGEIEAAEPLGEIEMPLSTVKPVLMSGALTIASFGFIFHVLVFQIVGITGVALLLVARSFQDTGSQSIKPPYDEDESIGGEKE
ncbi:cytochrome c oxidase subunit I [Pseudalkalibacillus decolorationis]|uniref:cytochrome c oxidase subunit I n=1 Tax=Pseudalkalibacillus decolorationis TaxID=163879 RepID=UPI0021486407|nr:cytochrome c oxidase subunit I [Pseudalkalibacillus decolorationis]